MDKIYNIKYLSTAQKDLLDIVEFIAKNDKKAAANLLGKIDKCISNLSYYPEIGLIPKDLILKSKGYRYLIIERYLVFYVFRNDTVEIRRVLHSKRNYQGIIE